MFQVSPASQAILASCRVSYRVSTRAGKVVMEQARNPNGSLAKNDDGTPHMQIVRDDNKMPLIGPGKSVAEIIDDATGLVYITAEGDDAVGAVDAALALVPTTPRPKTAAELRIEQNGAVETAKDREIARLKRDLAKLKKQSGPDGTPASVDDAAEAESMHSSTGSAPDETPLDGADEGTDAPAAPTPVPRGGGRGRHK